MKLTISALTVLGVLGALPFLANQKDASAESSVKVIEGEKAGLKFKLSVSGRDDGCTVVKKGEVEARRAELELSAECAKMMPRLADVSFWQEKAEGQLIFTAADGKPLLEFFVADGAAYESLKPVSPVVALTVY